MRLLAVLAIVAWGVGWLGLWLVAGLAEGEEHG